MSDASATDLDIENPAALIAYLRDSERIGRDERVEVRNLAGGVSNRTVLVTRPSCEAWVLKQALAKLRVKVDWFSDPARIHREALGMRWLEKLAPAGTITPLVFEDHRHHLLAMRAVPQPHDNLKTLLLEGRLDRACCEDYAAQFGRLLGAIHRESAARRDELSSAFADRSYFEALRIEPYYSYTAQQVPGAADFYQRLIEETRGRRVALVHGDYSPKNILVHDGKLILLDHEVIHWGDPAFDVGFALTHLLSKAHHLPARRKDLDSVVDSFLRTYVVASGSDALNERDLSRAAAMHTMGCLLARVCGRSPLEYLTPEERQRQQDGVIRMIRRGPETLGALLGAFYTEVLD